MLEGEPGVRPDHALHLPLEPGRLALSLQTIIGRNHDRFLGALMVHVSLRLAVEGDLPILRDLVRSYHAFEGVTCPGGDIDAAVSPLLGESDLGRIWLIDAGDATVGYVAICFGYSIEFGGRDAFIDEMYISEQYRGQAIGTEALKLVKIEIRTLGVNALHLEVSRDNVRAQRLYKKIGFAAREKFYLMSARQN